MAFRFPLQALLRLRQAREWKEREQLQLTLRRLVQARLELETFNQESMAAWNEFSEHLRAGMTGAELQLEAVLAASRAACQKALREQVHRLEGCRLREMAAFQKAQQQRKVVESLRAHLFETYRRLQERRGQRILDDLFLLRRARSVR